MISLLEDAEIEKFGGSLVDTAGSEVVEAERFKRECARSALVYSMGVVLKRKSV